MVLRPRGGGGWRGQTVVLEPRGGVERSDGGARAYGRGWRGQTVVLGPMGRGGEVRRWC